MENQKEKSSSLPERKDDFQKINGIGSSIEQALNSLGIYTYEELSNQTPENLAILLKNKVLMITPKRIESADWIGQARRLASEQKPSEAAQVSRGEPYQAHRQKGENGNSGKAAISWQELADFFVSFGHAVDPDGNKKLQTKVHHSQADQLMQWDGIAVEELVDWILDQAKLSESSARNVDFHLPEIEASQDQPSEEGTAYLEISNLWISEVTVPVPAYREDGPRALRAEGNLKLSGSVSAELAQQKLPYVVELYLVDLASGQSSMAASHTQKLSPGSFSYDIIQDFNIPPAGRHQLYMIVRLLTPQASAAHIQGPIIRVET